jgi:hypothetical protein
MARHRATRLFEPAIWGYVERDVHVGKVVLTFD